MADSTSQMDRIKALREKQAAAAKQRTADEAQLQILEQQRDGLYERCRKLGTEPAEIKGEIERRSKDLERDIGLVEERFSSLRPNGNGDGGKDDE
ncbi:MAG: hypothetical protein WC072_07725 [Methanoregulaceae archaeon]